MSYATEYYQRNKERIRAHQKEYRSNSPNFQKSNNRWKEANRDKMISYRAKYGGTPKGKFTKLKLRARAADIPMNIQLTDFLDWYGIQDFTCHYCGAKVSTEQGQKKLDGYSIDRKDNAQGYTLNNIAIYCNRCNMAKGSWFTEEQMLEIAHKYLQSGR